MYVLVSCCPFSKIGKNNLFSGEMSKKLKKRQSRGQYMIDITRNLRKLVEFRT